jgi:ElaB/YqjD/DUF883 family membrane-anchored ribosome-binding protein
LNESKHILDRLQAADRAHQKEAGGCLLLRCVKYLCALVIALFVADVLLHLTAGWRFGLLLALLGGILVLLGAGWYLAFVRRNRLEHIARFLEARDPALGSRLINLLQLQAQAEDASLSPLTRELARQAVQNYGSELRETPLETIARTGELRRHLVRAVWVLVGFVLLLAVFFRVSAVELARFADPFGDHPPYSFTRLEIVTPGAAGTNVLYGKSLVVRVKSSGHQPREVFLTSFPVGQPERSVTVAMFDKGRVGFDQLLDNIRDDLVIYAHTKNRVSLSKQSRISVVLTPQLEQAFVRVVPPAYTGLKAEEKGYAFKGVQALEGSEVHFRLQSNRPLRAGAIEFIAGDQPPQRAELAQSAENEVAGFIRAQESGRMRFTLTDRAGIPTEGDYEGALTITHDLPPEVRISEPERDAFVALDFKVKVLVEASDDYGLRTTRLHRGLNGLYSGPRTSVYDTVVRNVSETTELNIGELGVQPGDVISLFAEAVDTAPQPHVARSQVVRLLVISVADYNDFLREQTDLADTQAKYESLMDDLQELIEEQKKLGEAAVKMQAQLEKAEAKQREALTRELDNLLAKQNELNQKLNQHAERMASFVRESPLYDVEKELEKTLQEQAENVRRSADTNNAAAGEIARRSSPPEGPRQISSELLAEFKRESDDQVGRLGGAQQETEQKVVETLADMSAMQELQKGFSQFEALYRVQQDLTAQAQAYNRPGELSREDQLALKELAATEKQVGQLLEALADKLHDDAKAAEELFPKAAASARNLAEKIVGMRMPPLARDATSQMLAGHGEASFRTADRLRSEMEKLFSECSGGNCPSGSELDQYLQLQRSLAAGNNFAQMARSKKFGRAGRPGFGLAQGEGMTGSSGYAVADGSQLAVMGNEFAPSPSSATAKQAARVGKGAGTLAGVGSAGDAEKPDVLTGLNPINRQSGAVATEAGIEEYTDVVEGYFKAITTRKKP